MCAIRKGLCNTWLAVLLDQIGHCSMAMGRRHACFNQKQADKKKLTKSSKVRFETKKACRLYSQAHFGCGKPAHEQNSLKAIQQ